MFGLQEGQNINWVPSPEEQLEEEFQQEQG